MSRAAPLVDEIANELDTWPGVRIERRDDGAAVVLYERVEFGLLDSERGMVELRVSQPERDELVEHGAAEPEDADLVSHQVEGPSDVSEVLELFDRRYRDLRGDDDPYTSQNPERA